MFKTGHRSPPSSKTRLAVPPVAIHLEASVAATQSSNKPTSNLSKEKPLSVEKTKYGSFISDTEFQMSFGKFSLFKLSDFPVAYYGLKRPSDLTKFKASSTVRPEKTGHHFPVCLK